MDGNVYLQVQQTPKPLAQEPAEVPPLLVHSDLDKKKLLEAVLWLSNKVQG